ncbi:MAG: hypothetical protein HY243_14080 [Proteobacteria bacterium]|nr:hypothetical protein [Pseudomonadota bacterium]
MSSENEFLLCVYDQIREFYAVRRWVPLGLNPSVEEALSALLNIEALEKPDANVETDAGDYHVFSWTTDPIEKSTLASNLPSPYVVLAVRSDSPKEWAARIRSLLQALPEAKRGIDVWFADVSAFASLKAVEGPRSDEPTTHSGRILKAFNVRPSFGPISVDLKLLGKAVGHLFKK